MMRVVLLFVLCGALLGGSAHEHRTVTRFRDVVAKAGPQRQADRRLRQDDPDDGASG